jgi:hypothetical protein
VLETASVRRRETQKGWLQGMARDWSNCETGSSQTVQTAASCFSRSPTERSCRGAA